MDCLFDEVGGSNDVYDEFGGSFYVGFLSLWAPLVNSGAGLEVNRDQWGRTTVVTMCFRRVLVQHHKMHFREAFTRSQSFRGFSHDFEGMPNTLNYHQFGVNFPAATVGSLSTSQRMKNGRP